MIRTKSVHSPIDRHKDGLRILATRGHGRGLRGHCHVSRKFCRPNDHGRNGSRCECRLAPCQHGLIAKHAQGSAGGQMALDVEHIIDTRRGKPAQARGRLRCFDVASTSLCCVAPFPFPFF